MPAANLVAEAQTDAETSPLGFRSSPGDAATLASPNRVARRLSPSQSGRRPRIQLLA